MTASADTSPTQPTRPPMDGNRSDDIAMLSEPLWLEHGDDQYCDPPSPPYMGFSLTLYPDSELLYETSTGDSHNSPNPREYNSLSIIQQHLDETYTADGEGCSIDFNVRDMDWRDGRAEVYVEVEFSAGMYKDGESLEAWTARTVAGTPFYPVYNDMVLFFTAQHAIENKLRAELGLAKLCTWCHGTKTMTTCDEPCSRCEGTGLERTSDMIA